jgi:hypothetical protein
MEFKVVVEVEEYLVFWMRVVNIVVRHFEFVRWVGVKIGGIENRGFFGMKGGIYKKLWSPQGKWLKIVLLEIR